MVEYRKACGHLVQERIPFIEGVSDFESHGAKFIGASYSINDWKNRIEFFRNGLCDVCELVKHGAWIWSIGEGTRSRAKAIARTVMLLDGNYLNWQDFVTPAEVEKWFLLKSERSFATQP